MFARVSKTSISVKFERRAAAQCVPVEERQDREDSDDAGAVDHEERRHVVSLDHRLGRTPRMLDDGLQPRDRSEHELKEELEGVHVEQDDEDQRGVQEDRPAVVQAIGAEEEVVLVPDPDQDSEADAEGEEPPHRGGKLAEGPRDLERHDEQRDREREDGVGQSLQPRDFVTAPAKRAAGAHSLCAEGRAQRARHGVGVFRGGGAGASGIRADICVTACHRPARLANTRM